MRLTDGLYTASVPTQPPAAVGQNQLPPQNAGYPVAQQPLPARVAPGGVAQNPGIDPVNTASVTRQAVAPVANAAQQAAAPVVQAANNTVQQANTTVQRVHSTAQAATNTAQQATGALRNAEGWTRTGGTYITAQSGETVYNLAKRYGVPANAIMEANGMTNANIQAGQNILIPTYIHSRNAGVSAPDANADVRSASSTTGSRSQVALNNVPQPNTRPSEQGSTEPRPVASSAAGGSYVVQSGDTLFGIARKTGASADAIRQANNMTTDVVRLGQTLIIPGANAPAATQVPVTTVATQPAQTQTTPASASDGTYVVQSGDTLYGISRKTGASVDGIRRVNNMTNDTVRLGQRLIIPGANTPTTTTASNPEPAQPVDNSQVASIDRSDTTSVAPQATGVASMRWPAQGRVITGFKANDGGVPNEGIDISVPVGTPVKAAENGVVIYAGDGLKELGNTVLVRHDSGLVTVYGHADKLNVNRGDTVTRGQTIASSGMSGNARQPKLHFEVRDNTTAVDPLKHLN